MHLGLDNFDNYRHALTEVYVVETYQVAERFFKSLNAEYRCIKKVDKEKWIKKDKDGKNLSPLQQFASNLPKKNRGFVESAPESLLIDYYRLVRNWIIHRDDKTRKTALHCYDEVLRKHKDHISNCYAGLAAPSLPDELSFDDYYLFTRALKYFANLLNNAADVTLEDVAGYLAGDNVIVRELRKNAHNQSARQRYLSGKCKECFGIVSSADIDYILASTDKLLGITK
ncbi:MAG TPA: hypothetical protein VN328_10805 [Thermodesulfovibrionales bacterium]|nr:hypothetical protein [Thermodesulfovibrionales bacterium]